ncbi:MAG: hypothetical protein E7261_05850 [Lachnospiraceae bacterium]|nr:hypothetical protein [Lachnospiraceae bacterium]
MPHINRIRVNNVKYNFGTQYYDDFVLRLSGKNTIYDLANGGGKSVLMLLLLQNMLPNCTLDEKQPIEKLFRSSNNNTVIHSLIEWRLNDGDIKDGYKYMTTGFCARRASKEDSEEQTGSKDTASVEYFNYCIFYREFNANDIVNLPLKSDTERVTYNGLKAYLRDLEKKDYSLEIRIFDRKGDYQRFISQYGIYESEWEIIRGINKTEGHVRTYFETNYKTTRKVVEDMFISEIIQKSFRNKILDESAQEDPMAQTLLDIKDKLVELSRKKSDIKNYDRQTEVLEGFAEQTNGLGAAYQAKEASEDMLVKVYNSICKMTESEDAERTQLADKSLELKGALQEAKRQADTVKISIEEARAQELSAELKLKEDRIADMEGMVHGITADLKQKESANDYLDYIFYRGERDKLKETIDNAMKDKGELSKSLALLAAQIKSLKDEEEVILSKELKVQEEAVLRDREEFSQSSDKERELDKELAVLNNRQLLAEDNEREYKKQLSELWSKTALLFGTDIGAEYKKLKGRMEELLAGKKELEKKSQKIHDDLIMSKLGYEKVSADITAVNRVLHEGILQVEAQKESKKRVDAMKDAYNTRNIAELAHELEKGYAGSLAQRIELEKDAKEQEKLISVYGRGLAVPDSEEKIKIKDYLERCYGYSVVDGGEYLLKKSQEDREQLVLAFPLLPFGLVVKEGILQLTEDDKLVPDSISGYPVPLFDGLDLDGGRYRGSDSVLYPTAFAGWYMDENSRQGEIKKAEDKLRDITGKLEKLKKQEELLREESTFLTGYQAAYGDKENKAWEQYEKAKADLERLQTEREELINLIAKCESEEAKVKIDLQSINAQENSLKEETEVLERMIGLSGKIDELQTILREMAEQKNILTKRYNDMVAHIEAVAGRKQASEERYNTIKSKIAQLNNDWELLYKPFYREDMGTSGVVPMDYETAVSRFAGVKSAFDMQHGGLDDKYQLLNNYEGAMGKALQTLAYNGADENMLKDAYENHELFRTENEELLAIRERLNRNQSEIKRMQKEAILKRDEKNRIEGGVSHAVKAIIEKYGTYEEINIKAEEAKAFVAARESEIHDIGLSLAQIEARFADIEKSGRALEIMKKDLERIFKTDNIRPENTTEVFNDIESMNAAYEKYTKEFDKFRRDILARREDFEKGKRRLTEMLEKLEAYSLAVEIKESMKCPVSSFEVETLKTNIKETVACIALEKERVIRGISDMQALKDNFENQCLQTCANIKLELEKLSKLSTIRMDDEVISIISLQVPYVKDEFRKEKMEKYIDMLVEHADSMSDAGERLKYIRNGLAWKKLFSVIVTDMDAIRLNLYKRERIKEQSRYLRYEEAVGSTGQSQGIYIQFLIGVINYISNINSPNAQGGLKNVIFIDNPFGAAKDIYIWEPIFKLLKTNNVQLIVPARGATPAITGRFDVNYVLGQNMINGKLQTVVVDYFSSLEREELEYKELNYEQSVLQFM